MPLEDVLLANDLRQGKVFNWTTGAFMGLGGSSNTSPGNTVHIGISVSD